ncbi:MAG: cytochrome c [Pseudosphingobacterium sp.]|nr:MULTISPECIES: cytochrome c [Olivibacter]MCL4638746.1 cytochrome c [Olivibacter sp. UJ_SKK_5.1]MDM8177041.1 cytochrome c [Olivibacter sp. 47]MDX3912409.1 cytochrome c [Pseudosphingobacterium sp.]
MLAMNKTRLFGTACFAIAFAAIVSSCGDKTTRSTGWEFSRNMYDPIGYNPDQPNKNFANGQTAQTPPEGTTPVGFERFDYPNTLEGYEAASVNVHNPLERNEKNLKEGAHLFQAFCSPCHGPEGHGDGTIVNMEKFPPPPSYATGNSSRGGLMKDLTDGKIYHTITYGLNLMGSHASQLSPEERWKVVMYVHELQKK